jgi:hypothetical protein
MAESDQGASGRTPSDRTDLDAADDDAPVGHERTLASNRACVIAGVVAFALGSWINASAGAGIGRTLFGGLFLGVFTGFGLWLVTKARIRVRPQADDPTQRDPSAPPPSGGWANPTGGQNLLGKLGRALRGLRPRGPGGPRNPRR